MLKTVIIPDKSIYPLPIPLQYIGKPLEVLLYSNDELFEKKASNISAKPSDFFGTLGTSEGEMFHEYVTNSRSEWDRNI